MSLIGTRLDRTRLRLPKPVDSNVFTGVEVKSDEKEYELYYIYIHNLYEHYKPYSLFGEPILDRGVEKCYTGVFVDKHRIRP